MRFASAFIAISVFSAAQPAQAATLALPSKAVTYSVETVDVAKLMRTYKISQPLADLRAFIADEEGTHFGFVFVDRNNVASVYKDGGLMMQAIVQIEPDTGVFPLVFRFTSDGRLIHAVNPYDLFVDAKRLSTARNSYSYYTSAESVLSNGGVITYAETNSIREYRPGTRKITVRYIHDSERIVMLRRTGKDIVYTATDEQDVSRIYRNGELLYEGAVDNPANFLLKKNGDVYFFTATNEESFTLRRNDGEVVLTAQGRSAFLFEDPTGELWVVGYSLADDGSFDVRVLRGKAVLPLKLGNMEGSVSFLGQRAYAFRASPQDMPSIFYLYKNGKKTGQGFPFDGKRDATGIQFADNGKTYMRNFSDGHWVLYEDGKRLLPAKIRDAWYIDIVGRTVKVYATMR